MLKKNLDERHLAMKIRQENYLEAAKFTPNKVFKTHISSDNLYSDLLNSNKLLTLKKNKNLNYRTQLSFNPNKATSTSFFENDNMKRIFDKIKIDVKNKILI